MAGPWTEANWRIGTIGFAYNDWEGPFYPKGLRSSERLAYYARRFNGIELDTTFYAIPPVDRVRNWRDSVPEDFRFVLKAPQALTHDDRYGWLGTAAALDVWREFVEVAQELGPKLGTILIQFPPTFGFAERDALEAFLKADLGVRRSIEFRHESWYRANVERLLERHGVAWVANDLAPVGHAGITPDDPMARGYRPMPFRDTADWVYLRWCGRHDQYPSNAIELHDLTPRLEWWREKTAKALRPGREVFGMIGNSFAGHGPTSCGRLLKLLGQPLPAMGQPTLFD